MKTSKLLLGTVMVAGCVVLSLWGVFVSHAGPVQVQAYGPGLSAEGILLRDILVELRGLRADLAQLRPANLAGPDAAPKLLAQRCGRCHTDPADKGDGFVIFKKDGNAEVSANDLRRMGKKVDSGQMPPGGGLIPAERKLLSDYFNRLIESARKPG